MTPLVPLAFSDMEILCKLDFLFPTGSFKDRGATVLMSKMKEWGLKQVLMDSSGNAAAAVSAYAARAGIECDVYAPRFHLCGQMRANHRLWRESSQNTRPTGRLHRRRHESGERALLRLSFLEPLVQPRNQDLGVRGMGTTWIPWRQTPSSRLRDTARPSLGAYLGFSELLRAGYIDKLPKIFAAQAVRCAPMVRMWEEDLKTVPEVTSQRIRSPRAYPSLRPYAGSRCARPPARVGVVSSLSTTRNAPSPPPGVRRERNPDGAYERRRLRGTRSFEGARKGQAV